MAKREITLGTTFDGSAVVFSDGTAKGTLRCDTAELPEAMRQRSILAGIAHTIRDAGALPRDPKTGESPSIAAKLAAMRGRWECIVGGEWERQRMTTTPEERTAALRNAVFAAWTVLREAGKKPHDAAAFAAFLATAKLPDGSWVQESVSVASLARNEKIAAEMARQAARSAKVAVTFGDI